MKAVTDPVLLALVESMEVAINIEEEARREKAIYDQGVRAMAEASSVESQ